MNLTLGMDKKTDIEQLKFAVTLMIGLWTDPYK
jgi:hypothetical protein